MLLDRIYSVDEVIEQIDAVTPEQVQALAQRLFTDAQLNLSIVGPFEKDDDHFRTLLTLNK